MPQLRSSGGTTAPLTDEELAAAAAPPETAGTYYPPPQAYSAPPPPAPQPGLGGTPAPAPASQYYGGPAYEPGDDSTGYNNPNYVITYYPSTGAEPTARPTEYFWTQSGRTPPSNYAEQEIPASNLKPPPGLTTAGAPPIRPNHYMPGPPRNYIPGSTYIPQLPAPDPRIPYMDRVEQAVETHGMNPTFVPGSRPYRMGPAANIPYVSPGLGAGSLGQGPLSREGRPPAPVTRKPSENPWWTPDPREPQDYQPGSSYRPNYAMQPPLGSPSAMYRVPSATERYGGLQLTPTDRPPSKRRVDTIYPATGAPETTRSTGYMGRYEGEIIRESNDPGERVYVTDASDPYLMTRNPNAPTSGDREETLARMEEARQARKMNRRRGLFGSGR